MLNPPYVYGLAFSPSSPWLLAASGNGSIEAIHLDLKFRSTATELHSSAANFVAFDSFGSNFPHPLLLSSSNSGTIAIHTFEAPPEESVKKYSEVVTRQLDLLQRIKAANKMSKPQQKLLHSFESQLKGLQGAPKLGKVLEIAHPQKLNWLVTKVTCAANLFVADITPDITCYNIVLS